MKKENTIPFAILLYEKAWKRVRENTKTPESRLKHAYAKALVNFFGNGMYDEDIVKKVKSELSSYYKDGQEKVESTTLPPSSPQ